MKTFELVEDDLLEDGATHFLYDRAKDEMVACIGVAVAPHPDLEGETVQTITFFWSFIPADPNLPMSGMSSEEIDYYITTYGEDDEARCAAEMGNEFGAMRKNEEDTP